MKTILNILLSVLLTLLFNIGISAVLYLSINSRLIEWLKLSPITYIQSYYMSLIITILFYKKELTFNEE